MSSSAGVVPATGSPRHRQVYRLTTDSATILRDVHRFFVGERTAGRSRGSRHPVQRAAWATGVSLSTVSRVRSEDFFDGLPESRERERRERVPRIPDAERVRVREAVYSQYRNRSLPSLDTTLEFLKTANLVQSATGIGSASSFVWTRTKLAVAMQEAGFYFSRGPTHYDVARESPAIKAQRTN